jgi:hypothetical protein
VASFGVATALPLPDTVRVLATIPGLTALCGMVVQILQDNLAHQRQIELQRRGQDFTLSVASHMSNTTFDKHVEFVEAYFAKINEGLQKLSGSGPNEYALQLSQELMAVRRHFAPWLTAEIDGRLFPLEHALRRIGAGSRFLESLPVGDQRSRVVDAMYSDFMVVMGLNEGASQDKRDMAAERIVDHLREMLGTGQLTRLRTSALHEAVTRLEQP